MKQNVTDVIFTIGLLAVAAGFAWAWPPLGLIVPGVFVCGAIIISRLNSPVEQIGSDDAKPGGSE
jgi:hypothetical protein